MKLENWQQAGFGLYLHWPYCQSKCPYCDFNSHVAQRIDHSAWQEAYVREITRLAAETPGRVLTSVYFGGGTPSLMPDELVHAILDCIRHSWPMANDVEITLEANPGSVEAGRFFGYRSAGINRISMGIQALNDTDLQRLGRLHSVSEAMQAFEIARSLFSRVNFDLIYARQHQTSDAWIAELTQALGFAVDHLSLYQLTIEEGTAFHDRHRRGGLRGLPDEDRSVAMFDDTQRICEAFGLPAYEISNHAREGAESRHNLVYWRGGDYLGIGPGAHGRLTLNGRRYATEAPRAPGEWLSRVNSGLPGEKPRYALSEMEWAEEYLLMSLRLREGTRLDRLAAMTGYSLRMTVLADLQQDGFVMCDGDTLRATPKGRLLLNAVLGKLAEALVPAA